MARQHPQYISSDSESVLRLVLRTGCIPVMHLLLATSGSPLVSVSTVPCRPSGDSPCSHIVTYGCINIQSVNKKFDDIMDILRSCHLKHTAQFTVLGLTETWHDNDCAAFGRFRDAGFSVVDRAHTPAGA